MKSNQKSSQNKQTSLEGLQSVALKQQDLPLTSTVHSQESTVSEETGQKLTDKNCRMCGVELLVGENFTN